MKIVSVIPVHGRHSLLSATISRLYLKNKVAHVICVGSSEDRDICEESGAEFVEFENKPLGRKWNQGFLKAKEHKPDAVILMGSSNWVSENWIDYMAQYFGENMLIGKQDFNILQKDGAKIRMIRWMEYPKEKLRLKHIFLSPPEKRFLKAGGRWLEPVGIGRLLRRDFLDAIDWQPYNDEADKGLDSIMMQKLSSIGGTWCRVPNSDQNVQALKIMSPKWDNLNSYETYLSMPTVKEIITPGEFLFAWFEDALRLEL